MLIGIDISHHNQNMKNLDDLKTLDFVIMKASEGVRFRDPAMKKYIDALTPQQLRGLYHYARPDINKDAEAEALYFVDTIKRYIDGKTILALDVEGSALKVPNLDSWCCVWAQVVEMATGVLPMIYCSVSECKRFTGVSELSCGLWAAKWGQNKPTAKQMAPWEFWAIWQYTSDNIFSGVRTDADLFNGTREQWLKYAKVADK